MERKLIDNLLEDVNKFIFVRKYDKAWKMLRMLAAEKNCRDDLLVHLRMVELSIKLKTVDELVQEYKKLLAEDEGNFTVQLALTLLQQHSDQISSSDALKVYQDSMKDHEENAASYYGIALAMEMMGNLDRAIMNYEKSITIDPGWYPSYFGLSQLFYQSGDDKGGDRFFFMFEEYAPYNIYGNFATHRKLSLEYLEREMYSEAEMAITTLSAWWIENKGSCPIEVQIYENLLLEKIYTKQEKTADAELRKETGIMLLNQILEDKSITGNVLYFIAKSLAEFNRNELSLQVYKGILSKPIKDPVLVQQVSNHFLATGEYQSAKDVFSEAYRHHPDSSDVRFGLLIANLNLAGVNVDEYLVLKEQFKKLAEHNGPKSDLLETINTLLNLYDEDPDVHAICGAVYQSFYNFEKARVHYEAMHNLDFYSMVSRLRFAEFEMQFGSLQKGKEVLDSIDDLKSLTKAQVIEIHWLKGAYYNRLQDYSEAHNHLEKVATLDPWNISYIVLDIINLSKLKGVENLVDQTDSVLFKLQRNQETGLNWEQFDHITATVEKQHWYEIAYLRDKLRFLYAAGDIAVLSRLCDRGSKFNPTKATSDLLKLLNTNFDSPHIYWAIGTLAKESWQLETACYWYDQMMAHPAANDELKAISYLDLADCYAWRNILLPKAVEFGKLALELGVKDQFRAFRVLAHLYLRVGQVREAQKYLADPIGDRDREAIYLRGLLQYRNGQIQNAKDLWKPLLTLNSKDLRFHYIKQEIMRYYYDQTPYLAVS